MTWVEADPPYPSFQYEMWENMENAQVLVVERERGGPTVDETKYRTVVLRPNHEENPEPVYVVEENADLHTATRRAREYRIADN